MWHKINNILGNRVDKIRELSQTNDGLDGLPTGFEKLDNLLGGLHAGNLITIGGVSGIGKSAFVLNILNYLSIQKKVPVLFFSSEMTDDGISCRLLSQVTQISLDRLVVGQLAVYEWAILDYKMSELTDVPLYIESTHQLYIEDVINISRKAVKELGVQLIAIDYLQLMYHKTVMNDLRYVEINAIISQLKSLAMELNVPIIVVSQMNNKIDQRAYDDKIPVPSDLRDSGTIFSDSDVVMFIYRPEFFKIYKDQYGNDLRRHAEIIVEKQRNGPKGTAVLRFNGDIVSFYDEKPEPCSEEVDFYERLSDDF